MCIRDSDGAVGGEPGQEAGHDGGSCQLAEDAVEHREGHAVGGGGVRPVVVACAPVKGLSLIHIFGTGNIAGVAGAIAIGGPGAVFWMWCSALLGMCTKFSEVTLAVHFRERNKNGELVGGPMYLSLIHI